MHVTGRSDGNGGEDTRDLCNTVAKGRDANRGNGYGVE